MTDIDRIVRDQQLRVLLAGGERGPVLQCLFGVSPRTLKRLMRKTAMPVRSGRSAGPARGWLGRERTVLEQVLQRWVREGLGPLLAGEAPIWLHELARQVGLRGAEDIAAMVQRVEVHEQETTNTYGGEAVARLVVCATCHTPRMVVRRDGVQRVAVPHCLNPTCRASGAASTRISHLDDWRRRRVQEEDR
jgi:mono/diheme cytochrome c family protein